ncbi:MAG: pentapeptide repeat-containing protein [Cyanobacteria bacterium P01_H01_bin.21]
MRYLRFVGWQRWLLSCMLICTLSLNWSNIAQAENFDRQSLRQQSFAGQDLRGNNYTSTDMAEADLSNTDLRGVRLFDTNLTKANLENANMMGATLDGARFIRANLKNAVLEGAYAFSTDFRKADIEGADFTDVDLDVKTNDMLCEVATGVNSVTGRATKDTLYCP